MTTAGSLAVTVFDLMIEGLGAFIDVTYGALMSSWPAKTITTLYIVIVGYLILMGRAGEKSKDWALSIFLLAALGGIASNYGSYTEWVVVPVYQTASGLASVGASGGSDNASIETLFTSLEDGIGKTMAAIDNVKVEGNVIVDTLLYLKVGIAIILLAVLACVLYLAVLGYMCIAFFSLFMMLSAGGPMLFLASFKELRFCTWAWLRATANYTLWAFFIGAVSGIGLQFIDLAVGELTKWDVGRDGVFTKTLGGCMLFMALTIYMLTKTADWAAALSGGTASQTGVMGALGGMAGGALGGVVSGGMSALGGAAGGAARWGAGVAINNIPSLNNAYHGVTRAYSAMKGLGQIR